jgi:outer membrane beta-barrel protein
MVALRVLAAALIVTLATPAVFGEECIDQEMAEKLAFKRRRRGSVPRDFVKDLRHEFTFLGGWYVSDLFEATYVLGGAYTFHMTEDTGVEALFLYTHSKADVVRTIEDGRATTLRDLFATSTFLAASLVWYPFHGKLQLGGTVLHFDIDLNAGVGVVNSQTSRGVTGIGGLGFKFFINKAMSFRIDLKDLVYRQELLDQKYIVNDIALTTGLSFWLPFGF